MRELYEADFHKTRDIWKRACAIKRVGRVSSRAVSWWSRSPGCCGFSCCVLNGVGFFACFLFRFFFTFERTRPAARMRRLASFTSLLAISGILDSKMARTSILAHANSRRAVLWGCSLFFVPDGIQEMSSRGGLFYFWHHTSNCLTSTLLTWGRYLTPSPTQKTTLTAIQNRTQGTVESRPCYIKSNTGDHSEPPPLLFQPTTGNNKESSPPVHKTKHRGQWTVFPPLLCETEHRGR